MTPTRRMVAFGGVSLAGIGVQLTVLSLLSSGLSADYLTATLGAVVAALGHNFLWHRHWTWRDRPSTEPGGLTFVRFVATNGGVSVAGNMALMAVLVGGAGLPALTANTIAIAVCGLVNFRLADRAVFGLRRTSARGRPLLS